MRRHVIVLAGLLAALLSLTSAAGQLLPLDVPRLGPDDDYTYTVCPSAVLDTDGSLWLAVTVGRLVAGEWSSGYEQVRLYHYTDQGVTGEVVVDNRMDGQGGLFEECQLSLIFIDGNPLIAGTATVVPEGAQPQDRFGIIATWYRRQGAWIQYAPLTGHTWPPTAEPAWSTRWIGDPVLLWRPGDGLRLYWSEAVGPAGAGGWCHWLAPLRWPGAPVTARGGVSGPHPADYLADAAWTDLRRNRLVALLVHRGQELPPWRLSIAIPEYPTAIFPDSPDLLGPSSAWGRNPALLRDPSGVLLADDHVIFEGTPDLLPPREVPPGAPVRFTLWIWSDGAPHIPATAIRGPKTIRGETP